MFVLEQLIRVISTTAIQVLIIMYMNFKNIRRDTKRNILLFIVLFCVTYFLDDFIDTMGVRFFLSLISATLAAKMIYGLNFFEAFTLSIISLFMIIVGDSALLALMVYLLNFELFTLDGTFAMVIGNSLLLLITVTIILLKQFVQRKSIKTEINTKFFFIVCIVFIVIVCTLNLSFNKAIMISDPSTVIGINLVAFAVYFMICLFLFFSYFTASKQALLLEQQTREYDQLVEYTGIIEGLYEDIRNQKHDFLNVLFSIKGYVDNGRVDELKEYYYNSVLKEYRECPAKQILSSLNFIKQNGLKGILSCKLNQALTLGIKVYVNVFSEIEISGMELIDLCKIVGILMDNAIEAAAESPAKELHLGIESGEDTTSLVIANTYLQEPNLDRLFKRGASSKGKNRGLGLHNVKAILSGYPSVLIKTSVDRAMFFQELVFPG